MLGELVACVRAIRFLCRETARWALVDAYLQAKLSVLARSESFLRGDRVKSPCVVCSRSSRSPRLRRAARPGRARGRLRAAPRPAATTARVSSGRPRALRAEADAVAATLPPPPAPVEGAAPRVAPITSAPPALAGTLRALPLDDAAGCRAARRARGQRRLRALGGGGARGLPAFAKTSEQRLYASTGIAAEKLAAAEASVDDLQQVTIAVFVGSAAAALASGTLGGPLGLTWLAAALPILFLALGSTAPGLITQPLTALKGARGPDVQRARARHEAAHFLAGYLLGVPIRACSAVGAVTEVELHARRGRGEPDRAGRARRARGARGDRALGRGRRGVRLRRRAGSGTGDLATLQALMDRASPRIPPAEQVDITRWGAVARTRCSRRTGARTTARARGVRRGASVAECIAALEGARARRARGRGRGRARRRRRGRRGRVRPGRRGEGPRRPRAQALSHRLRAAQLKRGLKSRCFTPAAVFR